MNTILLKFYMHETRKHGHTLLYEYLLKEAKKLGIRGGSVFHGIAGYGRNGVLHEEHFMEIAGDLPIQVEFLSDAEHADKLIALLASEKVSIMYVKIPVEAGYVTGDF